MPRDTWSYIKITVSFYSFYSWTRCSRRDFTRLGSTWATTQGTPREGSGSLSPQKEEKKRQSSALQIQTSKRRLSQGSGKFRFNNVQMLNPVPMTLLLALASHIQWFSCCDLLLQLPSSVLSSFPLSVCIHTDTNHVDIFQTHLYVYSYLLFFSCDDHPKCYPRSEEYSSLECSPRARFQFWQEPGHLLQRPFGFVGSRHGEGGLFPQPHLPTTAAPVSPPLAYAPYSTWSNPEGSCKNHVALILRFNPAILPLAPHSLIRQYFTLAKPLATYPFLSFHIKIFNIWAPLKTFLHHLKWILSHRSCFFSPVFIQHLGSPSCLKKKKKGKMELEKLHTKKILKDRNSREQQSYN